MWDLLVADGYSLSDYDGFLGEIGLRKSMAELPVELLFSSNILNFSKCHIVFDSSLAYLLASSQHLTNEMELVIGADLSVLVGEVGLGDSFHSGWVEEQLMQETGTAPRSKVAGINTIIRYSRHYLDSLASIGRPIDITDTDNISFYKVTVGPGAIFAEEIS